MVRLNLPKVANYLKKMFILLFFYIYQTKKSNTSVNKKNRRIRKINKSKKREKKTKTDRKRDQIKIILYFLIVDLVEMELMMALVALFLQQMQHEHQVVDMVQLALEAFPLASRAFQVLAFVALNQV
jgi:hypothetical protein